MDHTPVEVISNVQRIARSTLTLGATSLRPISASTSHLIQEQRQLASKTCRIPLLPYPRFATLPLYETKDTPPPKDNSSCHQSTCLSSRVDTPWFLPFRSLHGCAVIDGMGAKSTLKLLSCGCFNRALPKSPAKGYISWGGGIVRPVT